MSFLVILVYVLVAYFQIKALKKKGYKRDLVTFCIFFLISFAFSILYSFGIKLEAMLASQTVTENLVTIPAFEELNKLINIAIEMKY